MAQVVSRVEGFGLWGLGLTVLGQGTRPKKMSSMLGVMRTLTLIVMPEGFEGILSVEQHI